MTRSSNLKSISYGLLIGCLVGITSFVSAAPIERESVDPHEDNYRRLQRAGDDLATLGVKLKTLLKEYEELDQTIYQRHFSERLTDAEILYLLGDHTRASLILYDLVKNDSNRSTPLYNKAVYYLAEAQFQIGNELASREYFQFLVSRGEKEHLNTAVQRLIQIGDRLERWDGLDVYIDVLAGQGALPGDIAYIHGKSLLRQQRYQDAIDVLEEVKRSSSMYHKSMYLLAVSYLQMGKYSKSEALFKKLVGDNSSYRDDTSVRELSALNRGRILLEMGDVTRSTDAYQFISRNSPLFEEALYEITWTYVRNADSALDHTVRKKEYEKALRALEILLLSETETRVTPEAKLLLGNILLRLNRHEEADSAFGSVVFNYGPVRDGLKQLGREAKNPIDYYDTVANRQVHGEELLPPLAMEWASDDKSLKKALAVVDDLDQGREWLTESSELAQELISLLDSDKQARFFPTLQDAQARRLALENSLVFLSKRFLHVERELIQGDLPPNLQKELQTVLEERAGLEPEFQKLPKDEADYKGRVNRMKVRVENFQKQAYRLKWDIEKIKREIKALREFVHGNPGILDAQATKEFAVQLSELDSVVIELGQTQADLEREIIREKNLVSVTTHAGRDEEDIRSRYNQTLEKEREILRLGHGSLTDRQIEALKTIRTQRSYLVSYHSDLIRFEKFVDDTMAHKALQIKAELLKEQSLIQRFNFALKSERTNAKTVVGQIASESLNVVEQMVHDIVLRADVGLIDVAWAIKEVQTAKITERLKKQSAEVGLIDSEWAEVLE